jgi:hypothetical protein
MDKIVAKKLEEKEKNAPTESWRPAAVIDIPQKEGFRRRLVHKDKLRRKMVEGWTPVEADKEELEARIFDGTQVNSHIVRGNLILCEMPEEKGKKRDAYYKRLNDAAMDAKTEEYKSKFGPGETYGEGAKPDEVD